MNHAGAVTVIVPCFNEADRLELDRFDELLTVPGLSLLFVDDGSTDATSPGIAAWAATRPGVDLLVLPGNVGKGEAIRAGMLRSTGSADVVAYLDADLASPPSEMLRLLDVIGADDRVDFAMGSRVALLGTNIERSRLRHYQGRIFATIASLVLGLPVYDTQCGLKAIRTTPALDTALATPFRSRWVFDVELIARMMGAPSPLEADRIREVPLEEWRDVGNSRLSVAARFRSVYDLLTVTR
jgi:glycosyltransferase involved in cell wall biosynthesis